MTKKYTYRASFPTYKPKTTLIPTFSQKYTTFTRHIFPKPLSSCLLTIQLQPQPNAFNLPTRLTRPKLQNSLNQIFKSFNFPQISALVPVRFSSNHFYSLPSYSSYSSRPPNLYQPAHLCPQITNLLEQSLPTFKNLKKSTNFTRQISFKPPSSCSPTDPSLILLLKSIHCHAFPTKTSQSKIHLNNLSQLFLPTTNHSSTNPTINHPPTIHLTFCVCSQPNLTKNKSIYYQSIN